MKSSKKMLLFIVAGLVVIAGLSYVTWYFLNEKQGGTPENPKDMVAIEVNGEKIMLSDYTAIVEQQKQNMGMSGVEVTEDSIKKIKDEAIESLITQTLFIQKAKDAGFKVTKTETDTAQKNYDEMVNYYKTQMGEAEAVKFIEEQLKSMNKTKEDFIQESAQMASVEKYIDELIKDVSATDQEIKDYYNKELETQKKTPVTSPEYALIEAPQLFVKHILISLPKEQQDEYNKMFGEGKIDEAIKYFNEKLALIKPKAQEVLDKAKAGEDFDKLIEKYNEDKSASEEEKNGYKVPVNTLNIKKGEITDLMSEKDGGPNGLGYFIIKAYDEIPEKIYTLEEKKDMVKEQADSQKKNKFIEDTIKEWKEKAKIVKHEDILFAVS